MTVVAIPAKDPTHALVDVVDALRTIDAALRLIVVDDGSRPGAASVFEAVAARGATVLRHGENLGKGEALKTALLHAAHVAPTEAVVTADCDGQHAPDDVVRVARAVEEADALILGTRAFDASTPLRSRVGNAAATALLRAATGKHLADTQTGLRGIPARDVAWVAATPGSGFDFELEVLLLATSNDIAIEELPITTIYRDRNAGSHFRPVRDSLRVLAPLARFAGSSLVAAVVDVVALLVLVAVTDALVPSIVVARLLSATVNFVVNRRYVFDRSGSLGRQIAGYAALALALLAANVAIMAALTALGLALLWAKAIAETALWLTSFLVQRWAVFRSTRPVRREPASTDHHPLEAGASRA